MASKHCAAGLRGAGLVIRCRTISEAPIDISRRICIRTLATAVSPDPAPTSSLPPPPPPTARMTSSGLIIPSQIPSHILPTQDVLTTIYSFPTLEPLSYTHYPHTHLAVPLRRDLLHKAVIYEGDRSRQGTASTKWRSEIHGSGQKIRPQKGSGRARLGDKKSPMLRGGGVAHGPKPRSFATDLPRKMYDRAWRMALSYRYRRGQIVVVDELSVPQDVVKAKREYWLRWVLDGLGWGKGGDGHSFFITERQSGAFAEALDACDRYGRYRTSDEVDVKNLLEMKRLVIEKGALERMLKHHQSDLRLPLVRTPAQLAQMKEYEALEHVTQIEMEKAMAAARGMSSQGLVYPASGSNELSMDGVEAAAAEAQEMLGAEEDAIDIEELESEEVQEEAMTHEELKEYKRNLGRKPKENW